MLQGDLTAETVMGVLSEMSLYNKLDQWVVNLSGVGKVDSSAIALMLELKKLAHHYHLSLSFTHIPKELMAIAKLSQLDSLLVAH